jgi:hypothetical protein
MRNLKGPVFFGLFVPMLIAACAMTRITSVWKDAAYTGQPRKIMVIRIAKDASDRTFAEDEFVRQLKARGTEAVASHTVMPEGKQADHAVMAAKLKEQGADAVLISRLASKKTVHTYHPGGVPSFPAPYGTWGDYYGFGYQAMYSAGYVAEDDYAIMEANLYDAGSDDQIWSAASETEIRGSDRNQIRSYIGAMVKAMAEQGLLRQ